MCRRCKCMFLLQRSQYNFAVSHSVIMSNGTAHKSCSARKRPNSNNGPPASLKRDLVTQPSPAQPRGSFLLHPVSSLLSVRFLPNSRLPSLSRGRSCRDCASGSRLARSIFQLPGSPRRATKQRDPGHTLPSSPRGHLALQQPGDSSRSSRLDPYTVTVCPRKGRLPLPSSFRGRCAIRGTGAGSGRVHGAWLTTLLSDVLLFIARVQNRGYTSYR